MKYTPVKKVNGSRWTRCRFCEAWMKNYYEVKSAHGKILKVSIGCLKKFKLSDTDFASPNSSKSLKPKTRESFEKLVTGHKFRLLGRVILLEGTHYWCAFCGNRMWHCVEIMRDDGRKLLVGRNCASKVALTLPPREKGGKVSVPAQAEKEDKVVEAQTTNGAKVLDKDIQELLKSLEDTGKD